MKFLNTLALLFALTGAGLAQAAPFQNGSFENGPSVPGAFITLNGGDTSITGWVVTGNSVDYIGNLWQPAQGTRSLDLSGNAAGGIEQTFDTITGHNYRVTFALAGNSGCGSTIKNVQVQATGAGASVYSFDTTGHSNSSMGWTVQTYLFTAAGAGTTLGFTSLENSSCGPALDDVTVADVTPVPTPALSLWALICLAGLLSTFALRNRRAPGR